MWVVCHLVSFTRMRTYGLPLLRVISTQGVIQVVQFAPRYHDLVIELQEFLPWMRINEALLDRLRLKNQIAACKLKDPAPAQPVPSGSRAVASSSEPQLSPQRSESDAAHCGIKHSTVEKLLDLIELRTSRGDCFVDIVYSGDDTTAKKGFELAGE